MALRLATTFKTLQVPTAYVRVIAVDVDVLSKKTSVKYQLWSSKAHRKSFLSQPLEIVKSVFPYTPNTGDIVAWAYKELKQLPEFQEAEDLLDVAKPSASEPSNEIPEGVKVFLRLGVPEVTQPELPL